MTGDAAGQPFSENTWLAAASIPLLLAILGIILVIIVPPIVRWILGMQPRHRYLIMWLVITAAFSFYTLSEPQFFTGSAIPEPQNILQQRLTRDEKALDKGVLTYPALPILKTNQLTTLTVTVTDLGKHPDGSMNAQEYTQESGMVVYPGNVPTGGIVGLQLICPDVYCRSLGSVRQAIVGQGSTRSWKWELTPLQPGPISVVITATTYDGMTNTVLDQEFIPVGLEVEKGPWWAALDVWWHTMKIFAVTTAGLITTVGGAVVVIAGGVEWVRRKKAKKTQTSAKPENPPEHNAGISDDNWPGQYL